MKTKLIIAVAALVLLGAAVLLLALWPEGGEDAEASPSPSPSPSAEALTDYQTADLKRLTITFEDGETYGIVPDGDTFRLEGDPDCPLTLKNSSLLTAVTAALVLTPKSVVEENPSAGRLSSYGLDPAACTIRGEMNDGTSFALLLGKTTPVEDGVYIMLEGGSSIMTVNNSKADTLMRRESFYYDFTLFPSKYTVMDMEGLQPLPYAFALLTLTPAGGGEPLTISRRTMEELGGDPNRLLSAYQILSPYVAEGYDTVIDTEFIPTLNAISLDSVLAKDRANDAEYGLDDPAVLEITDPDGEMLTLYLGKYDAGFGGRAVRLAGSDWVFAAVEGERSILDTDPLYLRNSIIINNIISTVVRIDVEFDDRVHALTMEHGEDSELTALFDGRAMEDKSARAFYRIILSLTAAGVNKNETPGQLEMVITFTMKDGSQNIYEYRRMGALQLEIFENGVDTGLFTTQTRMDALLDAVEKAERGETVED